MVRRVEMMIKFLSVLSTFAMVILAAFGIHWGALNIGPTPMEGWEKVLVFIGYWIIVIAIWWLIGVLWLLRGVYRRSCYRKIYRNIFGIEPEKVVFTHGAALVRGDLRSMVSEYESLISEIDTIRSGNPFEHVTHSDRERAMNEQNNLLASLERQKRDINCKMWDGYDVARSYYFIPAVPERKYEELAKI